MPATASTKVCEATTTRGDVLRGPLPSIGLDWTAGRTGESGAFQVVISSKPHRYVARAVGCR